MINLELGTEAKASTKSKSAATVKLPLSTAGKTYSMSAKS